VIRTTTTLCLLASACTFRHGTGNAIDGSVDVDSGAGDAPMGDGGCVLGAWNAPQPVASLNTVGLDSRPRLSPDELDVIFYSDRQGDRDIFEATRTSLDRPFSTPVLVPGINTIAVERDPALTPDGLQLFFATDRDGTLDIYTANRTSKSGTFSTPQIITALSTTIHDYFLSLSHDGLTIYFSSNRNGGTGTHDIWYSTRANVNAAFANVQLLAEVSSAMYSDHSTAISVDGRELYLSQTVAGGDIDIFVATRPDASAMFGTPVRVAELSNAGEDHPGWLSRDGLRFYYSHAATGDSQIYMATRACQ
jgi:Tol biopolymer transport system component